MPPDATLAELRGQAPALQLAQRIAPHWRAPLARLGALWLALLIGFARDWAAMAWQWWDSSTWNHVLLVPFILGWLVWQRAGALGRLQPVGWWPGAVVLGAAALLWVLGQLADVALARQLAVVAMLGASVPALLGLRVAAALLFPLGYLLALVPLGEELVPLLQMITAKITIALLHLSRIPADVTGVFIATPGGYFRVAEACSGVKFLIAMIAYGALAAHLCFRGWQRRALFMAACVVVPVLANGVRAYATIAIAQKAGLGFAQGFDHIFYGWVFFGLVMAGLMLAARRWFDRPADDAPVDVDAVLADARLARWEATAAAPPQRVLALGLAFVVLAHGWTLAAAGRAATLPPALLVPAVPGWQITDAPQAFAWRPRHGGADRVLFVRMAGPGGAVIDVSLGLHAAQGQGNKADGFGEGAVPFGGAWAWAGDAVTVAGLPVQRIEAPGPVDRLALTVYARGTAVSPSRARLRLAVLADGLLLRAQPTAALIVSVEERPGRDARADLAAFLAAAQSPAALLRAAQGEQ